MIDRQIIEDLKSRVNIEDVISSYVVLKRAGSNYKGLCPFHSERTPSFTVFPGTQDFHCFGCGVGGDVISFIMRSENLDYPQAIESLATRCGITLPESTQNVKNGVSRTRVLEMNKCAARFFRDMLYDEKIGAPGREYIAKRKLSEAVVKHFGLGYAPASFGMLRDHLKKNGFTEAEMTEGYLCLRSREKGNLYDCFRGRLMFPIIDVSGNIVAFGGRVLDDSQPKYLNSSDTPAFKKSKNLFALNYAKAHCAERLILCEGYMDVISLHAAGFENAVATLGTAITPEHARIMKRYSPKTIIAYDSDGAGQKAADRAFALLEEAGVEAKVIRMEGAKDPDEYIKKFGAPAFDKLLDEGRSKFDFKLDSVKKQYNSDVPEEKIRAVAEMCDYIAGIYSSVEREIYVAKLAAVYGIEKANVARDVESAMRKRDKKRKAEQHGELLRVTSGITDRINRDTARMPKVASLECDVIGMMLLRHEYIKATVGDRRLTTDDFTTEFNKRLYTFISEAEDGGGFNDGMLNESFTPDEVSRAMGYKTKRLAVENGPEDFRNIATELIAESAKERKKASGEYDFMSVIADKRKKENK